MSEVNVDTEEVFERIDDAFFALDDEWRFTLLNQQAAEVLDVDREAVVGEVIWDKFEAAVDSSFQRGYERAMETQEPVSFEDRYPPLDAWFEVNAYPSETGLSVYFRDVTERVEREQELERYETIVETVEDGIYTVDDGEFTMVNDAFCELTGYDREALLGSDVSMVADESVADAAATLEEELAAGSRESAAMEAPLQRADGGTIEAEATFEMLPNGDRVAVVRDVTEHRQREAEITRLQELLESAERIADLGGWEIDPETDDVFWTDHLFDILGLDHEEEPSLEGALDLYLDADRQTVEDAIEEALESGDTFDVEARIETPSGETRWLRIWGAPEYEDGEMDILRGSAQDVTERKEREQQLELYQRIVETVEDGIYAVDGDGDFFLVNDAFCELTGFDREEVLGSPVAMLYDGGHTQEVQRLVDEVVSGERPEATINLDIQRQDGETIPIEKRFKPFPTDGGVGRCGIMRDISERIEREEQLHNWIEQQEIVAALGQRGLEDGDIDALITDASRMVAEALDVDYCKVLDLDTDREELLLRQGVGWNEGIVGSATVSAVEDDSQAAYTLSASEPVVVEDLTTESRFSGPDLLTNHDVRSGISTIIGPTDDPWGILGTHDTSVREFSDQDVTFVQSVANVLGTAIKRHRDEKELQDRNERLAALNDINSLVHDLAESVFGLSDKSDIREQVCDRLVASDSYEFAWIGTDEGGEVVATTEAGVEEYLADHTLSLEGPPDDRGPTVQAHLTGEMQVVQNVQEDARYEQWREHAREYGYRASAAVPIVASSGQFGTLNVYSSRANAFGEEERDALRRLGSVIAYAFAAVERDHELQRERNRLEFMNRLLRHNLLNSLNVVSARLNLLDGRVDYEVSDHLETATDRTRDMIDFVETVRDVTKVIGRGDEQELRPVDLGDVLSERVERARQSYPAADFDLGDSPAVDVVADDLLGELIDNLLTNSVQHNDTGSPTVWVDATVTDDEVAVAIADDGPGITDEEKRTVFDREAMDLEDPGSGFGLYLVSEIIDSYDGSIEVEDSDAGGARFELTFERA